MDLTIAFECPRCGKTLQRRLIDLGPAQNRDCRSCGASTVLTRKSLQTLERDLEAFCNPVSSPPSPIRPPEQEKP